MGEELTFELLHASDQDFENILQESIEALKEQVY